MPLAALARPSTIHAPIRKLVIAASRSPLPSIVVPHKVRTLSHATSRRSASTMTEAYFKYIDPATFDVAKEKPWGKVDVDVTSFSRTNTKLPVINVRGQEEGFRNVDVSGFAVFTSPSTLSAPDFDIDTKIRKEYYAEVEQLLRTNLAEGNKVKKIVIFDHTIRKRDKDAARGPVQQIHVDQTPNAAEVRVRRHIEDKHEAEELLKKRYQLINVWRPIRHPASDSPLAVIDWRTTSPEDLIKVDLLYPKTPPPAATNGANGKHDGNDDDDRGKEVRPDPSSATSTEGYEVKGETYSVAPNPAHKLYYYKDMTPDEVMFIKCFDSWSEGKPNGKKGLAALTPHTAFEDPQTPKDAPGRQSIEVRALVFYE